MRRIFEQLAGTYQDYQEGKEFSGRNTFELLVHLCAAGYRVGLTAKKIADATIASPPYRLLAPAIAVGNLTVGGSGKTALVDTIASILEQENKSVAILSRGYGRVGSNREIIEPGQHPAFRAEFIGDEPLLLARRHPEAAILVDRNRAGAAADYERDHAVDIFIADDAFQYSKLKFDCSFLCLRPEDFTGSRDLFPLGRWREPPYAMRRADCVIVVLGPREQLPADHEESVREFGFAGPIIPFHYELIDWRDVHAPEEPVTDLNPADPVGVFCGIARPRQFVHWLREFQAQVTLLRSFPDHYNYRQQDIDAIVQQAKTEGYVSLVTTEKDAVKLARLSSGDIRILYPNVHLTPVHREDEFREIVVGVR